MLKVLMKPPSVAKIRQLQQDKGTAQKLNRQRNVKLPISERQTEKINEQVEYSIGLFVTIAIGLGLFVGVMKMGAFVGEPVKQSALELTDTFEAMNGFIKSTVPTVLIVCLFVAFIKLRQTDN